MKMLYRPFLLILLALSLSLALAAEQGPNPRAEKYLKVLLKRPGGGYLFDKFYQSWMETSTQDALVAYLEKKRDDPNHVVLLAHLYHRGGEFTKAIECFDEVLEAKPHWVAVLQKKAEIQSLFFDEEGAIASLTLALEHAVDGDRILEMRKSLGRSHLRNGQSEKAIEVWKALVGDADEPEFTLEVIELIEDEGLFEEALTMCIQASQSVDDPYRRVQFDLRKGAILQRIGKAKEALPVYDETLAKLAKGSWLEREVLERIALLFRREDDAPGHADFLGALVEKHPGRTLLLKASAEALMKAGKKDEAMQSFRTLLEITPGNEQLQEEYLDILLRLDENKKALALAQRLLERERDNPERLLDIARIHHRLKDGPSSLETLNTYLDRVGKSEQEVLKVSRLMSKMAHVQEATNLLQEALQQKPQSFALCQPLAMAHYRSAKSEQADALLLQHLQEHSPELEVVLEIVSLLRREGRKEALDGVFSSQSQRFEGRFQWLREQRQYLKRKESPAQEWVNVSRRAYTSAQGYREHREAAQWVGEDLLASGDLESELEQLSSTTSPDEAFLLTSLYLNQGDIPLAKATNVKARQDHPKAVDLVHQAIAIHKSIRDWSSAANTTESLLTLEPRHRAQTTGQLVELEIRNQAWDKAMHWVRAWQKLIPGSKQPLHREAEILTLQGKTEEVIDLYREAVNQNPDSTELMDRLADSYLRENQVDSAIQCTWRSLELTEGVDQKLSYINELIESHRTIGREDLLQMNLRQRLERNPDSLFLLLALARVHREQGEHEVFQEYMMRALAKQPESLPLLREIARIHKDEGDLRKAISMLLRAKPLDPTTGTSMELAKLYQMEGQDEMANDIFFEIAGGDQMDETAAIKLVSIFIDHQQYERSIQLAEDQIIRFPKSADLVYLLACAQELQQETEAAVNSFLTFLDLSKAATPPIQPHQNSHRSRRGYWEKIAPPLFLKLQGVSMASHSSYSHAMHLQGQRGRHYGHRSNKSVVLPSTVQESETFALNHLATINKMNPQHFDLMVRGLSQRDIDHPELLLRATQQGVNLSPEEWDALEKKYANTSEIKLTRVMSGLQKGSNMENNLRRLEEAKSDYPTFVASMLFHINHRFPVPEEKLLDALDHFISGDAPMDVLFQVAGQVTRNSKPEMAKVKEKLMGHLLKTIEEKKDEIKQNSWSNWVVLGVLVHAEDLKPLIRYIEDDLSSASTQQRVRAVFHHHSGAPLLRPLELKTAITSQSHHFSVLDNLIQQSQLDLADLHAMVDEVKDLRFKLYIAIQNGDDALVDSTMESLAKESEKKLNDHMLMAVYHSERESTEPALNHLNMALKLATSLSERKAIHSAILNLALEDESIKEAGKRSALKLKFLRLEPREKFELMEAFHSLGLESEAEKMEKANQATMPMGHHRGYRPPQSQTRLEQAIEKGEWQDAAQQMVVSYRRMIPLALPARATQVPQRFQDQVSRHLNQEENLKEAFLLELKPKGEGNSRQHLIYAHAQEWFGTKEKAVLHYEKVVELTPKHFGARLRLSTMNPEQTESMLKPILNRHNAETIFQISAESTRHHRDGLMGALPIAQHLVHLIDMMKTFQGIAYPGLSEVLQELGNSSYRGSQRFPGLQDEEILEEVAKLPPKAQEFHQQRVELMVALLETAMKDATQSERAFTWIEPLRRCTEIPEPKVLSMAISSLESSVTNQMPHHYHSGSNQPKPLDLIAKAMAAGNAMPVVEGLLKQHPHHPKIKKLLKVKELYTCSGEAFLDTLQQLLPENPQFSQEDSIVLADGFRAAVERDLVLNLDPLFMSSLEKQLRQHQHVAEEPFTSYLKHRLDHADRTKAMASAQALVNLINDMWDQIDAGKMNKGNAQYTSQRVFDMLEPLWDGDRIPWDVIEMTWSLYQRSSSRPYSFLRHIERVKPGLEDLMQSPLLGPWTSFRTYRVDEDDTLLENLVDYAKNPKKKNKILEGLQGKAQDGLHEFGARLFMAVAEGGGRQELYEVAVQDLKAIEAAEPEMVRTFSLAFNHLLDLMPETEVQQNEAIQRFITLLDSNRSSELQKKVEEISSSRYKFDGDLDELTHFLIQYHEVNPEKAFELFDIIVRKSKSRYLQHGSSYNGIRMRDCTFHLASGMVESSKNPGIAVFASDKIRTYPHPLPTLNYRLERFFGEHLEASIEDLKKKGMPEVQAALKSIENLAAIIGERDLYISNLTDFNNNFKGKEKEVLDGLLKMEKQTPFIRELVIRIEHMLAKENRSSFELSAKAMPYLMEMINSEDSNAEYRLQKHLYLLATLEKAKGLAPYLAKILELLNQVPSAMLETYMGDSSFRNFYRQLSKLEGENSVAILKQINALVTKISDLNYSEVYLAHALPGMLDHGMEEDALVIANRYLTRLSEHPESYVLFQSSTFDPWTLKAIPVSVNKLKLESLKTLRKKRSSELPYAAEITTDDLRDRHEMIKASNLKPDLQCYAHLLLDALDGKMEEEHLERYRQHDFEVKSIRTSASLVIHAIDPQALPEEDLSSIMSNMDVTKLLKQYNRGDETGLGPFLAHAKALALEGDRSSWDKLLTGLTKNKISSSSRRDKLFSKLLPTFISLKPSVDSDAWMPWEDEVIDAAARLGDYGAERDSDFIENVGRLLLKVDDRSQREALFKRAIAESAPVYKAGSFSYGNIKLLDGTFHLVGQLANSKDASTLQFALDKYNSYENPLPRMPSGLSSMHAKWLKEKTLEGIEAGLKKPEAALAAIRGLCDDLGDAPLMTGSFRTFSDTVKPYSDDLWKLMDQEEKPSSNFLEIMLRLTTEHRYRKKAAQLGPKLLEHLKAPLAKGDHYNPNRHLSLFSRISSFKENREYFETYLKALPQSNPSQLTSVTKGSYLQYVWRGASKWSSGNFQAVVLGLIDHIEDSDVKKGRMVVGRGMEYLWPALDSLDIEAQKTVITKVTPWVIERSKDNYDRPTQFVKRALPLLIQEEQWEQALGLAKGEQTLIAHRPETFQLMNHPPLYAWIVESLPTIANRWSETNFDHWLDPKMKSRLLFTPEGGARPLAQDVIDQLSPGHALFASLFFDALAGELSEATLASYGSHEFSDWELELSCHRLVSKFAPSNLKLEGFFKTVDRLNTLKEVEGFPRVETNKLTVIVDRVLHSVEAGDKEPLEAFIAQVKRAKSLSSSSYRRDLLKLVSKPTLKWLTLHPEDIDFIAKATMDILDQHGAYRKRFDSYYLREGVAMIQRTFDVSPMAADLLFDHVAVVYAKTAQKKKVNGVSLKDATYYLLRDLSKPRRSKMLDYLLDKALSHSGDLPPLPDKLKKLKVAREKKEREAKESSEQSNTAGGNSL